LSAIVAIGVRKKPPATNTIKLGNFLDAPNILMGH
jgi:hypothetical protein